MSELVKGFRKGRVIGEFNEAGVAITTVHKSINAAKRANRVTKYPVVRDGVKVRVQP